MMNHMQLFRVRILFFFVWTSVFCSCSNKTTSEHAAADSVMVVADSTWDMFAPVTPSPSGVPIPEDTMKALKMVYVIEKEGATAYTKMEDDAEMASVLSYGQKLDVLEEYPEWYKVRFRNNSEIYIFYVLKKVTSTENPVGITLFYPEFEMIFIGFIHEKLNESESPPERSFYKQHGENNAVQIIQMDTMSLYEDLDSYQEIKRIKFVPKNKNDRFVVSLAYGQILYEVRELTHNPINNDLQWFELTPYKILPDTGGIFMPGFYGNLSGSEQDLYRSLMSKKHHMKDTTVVIPGEYEINTDFVYKNRYFCYDLGGQYLRIQRFLNGKLKETRYIHISQQESGC